MGDSLQYRGPLPVKSEGLRYLECNKQIKRDSTRKSIGSPQPGKNRVRVSDVLRRLIPEDWSLY